MYPVFLFLSDRSNCDHICIPSAFSKSLLTIGLILKSSFRKWRRRLWGWELFWASSFFLPNWGSICLERKSLGFELKINFWVRNFCSKWVNSLCYSSLLLYSSFWGKTKISSCMDSRRGQDQAWCGFQVCFERRKWVTEV